MTTKRPDGYWTPRKRDSSPLPAVHLALRPVACATELRPGCGWLRTFATIRRGAHSINLENEWNQYGEDNWQSGGREFDPRQLHQLILNHFDVLPSLVPPRLYTVFVHGIQQFGLHRVSLHIELNQISRSWWQALLPEFSVVAGLILAV